MNFEPKIKNPVAGWVQLNPPSICFQNPDGQRASASLPNLQVDEGAAELMLRANLFRLEDPANVFSNISKLDEGAVRVSFRPSTSDPRKLLIYVGGIGSPTEPAKRMRGPIPRPAPCADSASQSQQPAPLSSEEIPDAWLKEQAEYKKEQAATEARPRSKRKSAAPSVDVSSVIKDGAKPSVVLVNISLEEFLDELGSEVYRKVLLALVKK